MDPLVGQTFADRYLIEERIGSGAMGEVYRARHVKIGKSFAVKVLRDELLKNEKVRKRFDREAELAGTLKHPNIVGIVDVGETPEGVRYLVMELAVGLPLSALIAEGPMPAARAVPLLRQLCDALHHAHDRGLVHRDFKPDNVIVEQRHDGVEFPRIIDFGIAILREDLSSGSDRLTTSGVVLGTPQYLAPEQAFGSGDHRIDLFALGVVSYEMLTGRLPYDGEGAEVARANLTMATPPFGVRVPTLEVDPLLEAFTLRLMKKSPELRPETGKDARELLDLIERDRGAAAELLGIDLSPRLLGRTEESQPVARNTIGETGAARPVTIDTGESAPLVRPRTAPPVRIDTGESAPLARPRTAPPVARARSVAAVAETPRSRRAWMIAGTATVMIALGAVIIVVGSSSSSETGAVAPPPKAGTDNAGADKAAADNAGDNAVGDKAAADRPAADNTAADKSAADKTAADKRAADKAAADKTAADKTAADKTAADKTAADKTAADKTAADKAAADKRAADEAVADKRAADEAVANKRAADKAAADRAAAARAAASKAVADKAAADRAAAAKVVADKAAANDPTSKDLADLYVAVGRELKRYADNKGANTDVLSYRYRLIKIADALGTADRRRAAAKELQSIRAATK